MGRPKGSKNKISRKIKTICKRCGKKFEFYPYRIKNNPKYCSFKCNPNLFQKGFTPWNKGKFIPNRGHYKKGHIPWITNKHHSKETKIKIKNAQLEEKSSNWKGGKIIDSGGYVLIKNWKHPFCSNRGYVRRSHLIMEKVIGRYIVLPELVHHKGIKYPIGSIENKQDDRPENLKLFPNKSEHTKFHRSYCI